MTYMHVSVFVCVNKSDETIQVLEASHDIVAFRHHPHGEPSDNSVHVSEARIDLKYQSVV